MKFFCEKSILSDAINIVQKAISPKSTLPILEGILLTANDGFVILTGNDLEIGIECKIEAEVSREGAIVLNGKVFGEMIRKLPNDVISIESDENLKTTIKCQKSVYDIIALSAVEFPEIPAIDEREAFSMSAPLLKSMIRQTIFAVSLSENKPTLTGTLFDISEGFIKLVAVDGFRLALRKEELKEKDVSENFIVPGKTLGELSRIIKDDEADISVKRTDRHVLFEYENSRIISRLLDGDFLKYESIIPVDFKIETAVFLDDFIKSVERTDPIVAIDIYKSPVKLGIDDDLLRVSCMTATGRVEDVIAMAPCGEKLDIGFNQKYLHDALKACDGEKIKLYFNTPLTPCIIKPFEGEAFLFMILPVRLRADE